MKKKQLNQKNSNNQAIAVKNPMLKIHQFSIHVLMLSLLSLLLFSCSGRKKDVTENTSQINAEVPIKTEETVTSTQNYEIVPNKKVCMVYDRFMEVDQIPIDVNGITYYGCCENCVGKLQKNEKDVRFGNNPLTNTKVDKASAVIVQDKTSGNVFYFASKENALTFVNKKNNK